MFEFKLDGRGLTLLRVENMGLDETAASVLLALHLLHAQLYEGDRKAAQLFRDMIERGVLDSAAPTWKIPKGKPAGISMSIIVDADELKRQAQEEAT